MEILVLFLTAIGVVNCQEGADKNSTKVYVDHHKFYITEYFKDTDLFTDLLQLNHSTNDVHKIDKKYKPFLFNFTFYGQNVDKLIITSQGFVSASWKLKMQTWYKCLHAVYIAPLMSAFNVNKTNNESGVFVLTNPQQLIVQWNEMLLNATNISCTFQTVIHRNGTIVMVYKNVPSSISNLTKIRSGLRDSFSLTDIISTAFLKNLSFEFVYQYHAVHLNLSQIQSGSAFRITPVRTCNEFHTCRQCLSAQISFDCRWCPRIQTCSSRISQHLPRWLLHSCHVNSYSNVSQCSAANTAVPPVQTLVKTTTSAPISYSHAVVIAVLILLVIIIVSACMMFIYAYTHPQTRPGRWLIEHRPSTWFRPSYNTAPDHENELI